MSTFGISNKYVDILKILKMDLDKNIHMKSKDEHVDISYKDRYE